MQQTLDITRTSRTIVSQMLAGYTLDQLNTIPEGYSNNLIWNIAHIIVVQQMLVYKSGLPMMISDEMVEKYKKRNQKILQLNLRSMKSNYLWKPSIRLKAI
jgi:hypothetical protein